MLAADRPAAAALLSLALTLAYVVPFYFFHASRPSRLLSRDAPAVIRARVRVVTAACVMGVAVTALVARPRHDLRGLAHLLGLWPLRLADLVRSLALVALLFAGPLFEAGLAEGHWRSWLRPSRAWLVLRSWVGWRNYVVGPVSEEVFFRSVLVPIHLLAGLSPAAIVFVTPLYFGIAHAHHFYEFRITHPECSLLVGVARTVLQLTYTSLFGFYASFLFLRTANLPAAILAHAFCNWMGLPRFWGRLDAPTAVDPQHETVRFAPNAAALHAANGKLGWHWTVAYYLLLVAGAYGFYAHLWSWTESPNALVHFGQ